MSANSVPTERPQHGDRAVARRGEADSVRNALEKMKPQFAMALPRHLTPDRLLRVAMTAIQNTPKLLECDRTSLYSAIMVCAQLGLEPDGVLGQAYLVPFAGKVQFIPGYKGLITLARNSGDVVSIAAHEVRENDHFRYSFGLDETCEHIPAVSTRGDVKFFYAVARFKDGGHHFDVMSTEEVNAIRDASKGYQAAKRYAKNGVIDSPWETHYVEMGKKTVVRRIAKYLPLNVQKAAALADSFEAGHHSTLDVHGDVVIEGEPQQPADQAHQISAAGSKLESFEEEHGAETAPQEEVTDEAPAPAVQDAPLPAPPKFDKKVGYATWKDAIIAWISATHGAAWDAYAKAESDLLAWVAENRRPDWEVIQQALDDARG